MKRSLSSFKRQCWNSAERGCAWLKAIENDPFGEAERKLREPPGMLEVMFKRLTILAALLTSCAPATAQLHVSAPQNITCLPDSTLTPVLGIAVPDYFDGDRGNQRAKEVKQALEDIGFKVVPTWQYKLIDKASVKLDGRITQWANGNREESERIGAVRLNVTDLNTDETLFSIEQTPARSVFQAPKWSTVLESLTATLRQRLCQARPDQ